MLQSHRRLSTGIQQQHGQSLRHGTGGGGGHSQRGQTGAEPPQSHRSLPQTRPPDPLRRRTGPARHPGRRSADLPLCPQLPHPRLRPHRDGIYPPAHVRQGDQGDEAPPPGVRGHRREHRRREIPGSLRGLRRRLPRRGQPQPLLRLQHHAGHRRRLRLPSPGTDRLRPREQRQPQRHQRHHQRLPPTGKTAGARPKRRAAGQRRRIHLLAQHSPHRALLRRLPATRRETQIAQLPVSQ
mmetsp:Transcript_31730/g.72835  ORF Transcript_31730/g.72835 Transcript_31730/m.72835 type:complete len:239 (+) Transcript_31730:850-1566(+)